MSEEVWSECAVDGREDLLRLVRVCTLLIRTN